MEAKSRGSSQSENRKHEEKIGLENNGCEQHFFSKCET